MEYLSLAVATAVGLLFLACTFLHLPRVRIYRETYKNLKDEDFFINHTKFGEWVTNQDRSIIYFENGDMKLCGDVHLFNSIVLTYMSPVSAYWYIKFKRFFTKIRENNDCRN